MAALGFCAHADVDREGNAVGLGFLSSEEYAELVTRFCDALEIPEGAEDSASFRSSVTLNS